MERDSGLINLIVALIVILGSVAGALAQAWRKIRNVPAEEEGDPEHGIDWVDNGGELQARPAPNRGLPRLRTRAAPVAAADEGEAEAAADEQVPLAAAEPAPEPDSEPEKGRRGLTLDERLFANRRLTSEAKFVLAKEILDGPRFRRPRR